MAMSQERQRLQGWWRRQGSLRHHFQAQTKRVCYICGGNKGDAAHV